MLPLKYGGSLDLETSNWIPAFRDRQLLEGVLIMKKSSSERNTFGLKFLWRVVSRSLLQVLGDLFTGLHVQYNLPMFPDIYVTYEASTVMLSPKTYCNPNSFLFRENSSDIVIAAHRFLNRLDNNTGCPQGQIRASVRYQ